MTDAFYQMDAAERRRLLADLGFVRDEDRIWRHADGRALGEGVALALTDRALQRYLGVQKRDKTRQGARRGRTRRSVSPGA